MSRKVPVVENSLSAAVTEPGQAMEVLRESEEKFRKIFQSANDGLIYLDKFGKILDVNEKTVQIYGASKEELLGRHFTSVGLFSAKDIPVLMGNFAKILAGKRPLITLRIKNKKGEEKDLECSADLMKIGNKIAGVAVVTRDITERRAAEEQRRRCGSPRRSIESCLKSPRSA